MCSSAARAVRFALLIFRAPYEAAGGWREGPAGVAGKDASHFSPGQEPRRKARNPAAYLEGVARKAPIPGGPFFGLLFFGQAKKSDSAFGRRAKRPPRRRASSPPSDNQTPRLWIPASAGMTTQAVRLDCPSPQPSPKRGEGAKPQRPSTPNSHTTRENPSHHYQQHQKKKPRRSGVSHINLADRGNA
jgi:hypothetical protein